jgi:hypothetical protein
MPRAVHKMRPPHSWPVHDYLSDNWLTINDAAFDDGLHDTMDNGTFQDGLNDFSLNNASLHDWTDRATLNNSTLQVLVVFKLNAATNGLVEHVIIFKHISWSELGASRSRDDYGRGGKRKRRERA